VTLKDGSESSQTLLNMQMGYSLCREQLNKYTILVGYRFGKLTAMLTFIHNIYGAHEGLTWNEIKPKLKCFACKNRRDYIKFRACTYLWND